jgi:hypothetical protein
MKNVPTGAAPTAKHFQQKIHKVTSNRERIPLNPDIVLIRESIPAGWFVAFTEQLANLIIRHPSRAAQ